MLIGGSALLSPQSASGLTVLEAITYVLETNPEIKAAEANKQAIEFELDQARSFWAPRVDLEARTAASLNDGTTTPDLTSADDAIFGYEVAGRITQRLFDGYEARSEIERQAYRIDAAALRVLERAEFLSLEAVRVYADVLRTDALVRLASQNLTYHRDVFARIERAFASGVVGIGDLQQAEERVFLAEDTLTQFRLNAEDTRIFFLETVGVTPDRLSSVPSVSARVPGSLDKTLAVARQNNPTIKFLQADVGSAEAQARRVASNRYPTLNLEAEARAGRDMRGFEGDVRDAEIGLVLRYDFQGSQKSADRQEQIRRVSESRAQLLRQTRLVEREVRQSWANLQSANRRVGILDRQATLATELLQTYEQEFEVGNRSLLDVLNTQNAKFQAEANLTNARSLQRFVNYRLLAAAGVLLPTLGIEPPEDTRVYARQDRNVPAVDPSGAEARGDARSFSNWRRGISE